MYTFLFLLLQLRIFWSLKEHCINSNQKNKAMIFDINILAKEEWWLEMTVVGKMCSWRRMLALLCAYSLSSVSAIVPLCCSQFSLRLNWWKRALLCEKGERTMNVPLPFEKSQLFTARSKRASQSKSPSVYLMAEDTSETQFFRKTLSSSWCEFWDTVTAISAPAFSSLWGHFTLPPLVNYGYPPFPRHWPVSSPTSPSPSSMEIQHTCYHVSVMLKIFRRLTLGVRKIL